LERNQLTDFERKKVIPDTNCVLQILNAENTDAYGKQTSLKLEVVDGEQAGHVFTDYCSRDENTGRVRQGTKLWSILEAALGPDFDERYTNLGTALSALKGKRIMARVTKTKTGSRNRLEFGTIGSVPEDRDAA
jgi:hypothetical protein